MPLEGWDLSSIRMQDVRFDAKDILNALQDSSRELGAKLVIALLPGPSFINQPGSLSARYQGFLHEQLVAGLAERPDIQVIDLASMLAAADTSGQPWYFPHEGHLTPQGHQLVARLLAENLSTPPRHPLIGHGKGAPVHIFHFPVQ